MNGLWSGLMNSPNNKPDLTDFIRVKARIKSIVSAASTIRRERAFPAPLACYDEAVDAKFRLVRCSNHWTHPLFWVCVLPTRARRLSWTIASLPTI